MTSRSAKTHEQVQENKKQSLEPALINKDIGYSPKLGLTLKYLLIGY